MTSTTSLHRVPHPSRRSARSDAPASLLQAAGSRARQGVLASALTGALGLAGLAGIVGLAGCANQPVQNGASASGRSPYEQAQFDRAQRLTRQGDLAEAALSWEILTVIRPGDAAYAEQLRQVRERADRQADTLSEQARQASKRHDSDQATRAWLGVLALRPQDAEAADALRTLERERNARDLLGRPSRLTMNSRAVRTRQSPADVDPARAPAFERNDLEHASMLAAQGEYDAAIALLNDRPGKKLDALTRDALADLHYRKAMSLAERDPKAALAAANACLQLSPRHPGARKLVTQLKAPRSKVPGKQSTASTSDAGTAAASTSRP